MNNFTLYRICAFLFMACCCHQAVAQCTVALSGGGNNPLQAAVSATPAKLEWKKNGNVVKTTYPVFNTNGTIVAGGNGSGSDANQFNRPNDVAVDNSGNVYVCDSWNQRIQKWAPGATAGVTVAGGNGQGAAANQFDYPWGIALDNSGNLYVADFYNSRIQKWAPGATAGVTVAGGNGYGNAANQFGHPHSIVVTSDGTLYVSDGDNERVQKWAPGATSGVTVAGGNGNGNAANQLNGPIGIALDEAGNIFIADAYNDRIQKWAPGATTGITVAGGNGTGTGNNQFSNPFDVTVDKAGSVYVADSYGLRIQRYEPGATDGTTLIYSFSSNYIFSPWGITLDETGNIFVADALYNYAIIKYDVQGIDNTLADGDFAGFEATATYFNGCIASGELEVEEPLSITLSGGDCAPLTADHNILPVKLEWKKDGNTVKTAYNTYSGSGTILAGNNGTGSGANQLDRPTSVAIDKDGNTYVCDSWNHRVQKWAPGATSGVTVAGGNGLGSAANQLYYPWGIALDKDGNLYVADFYNSRIQKWAPGAASGVTVAGGNGYGNNANQFGHPYNIVITDDGTMYVSDGDNDRVQKWAPGATSGVTVAGGNGSGSNADQLSGPIGLAVDGNGNVFVADAFNERIQKWAPGATSGVTVAGGNGTGLGSNQFMNPFGVALDKLGNLYIADAYGLRVQRYEPGATEGTTVVYAFSSNYFFSPWGITLDKDGNIIVADALYSIAVIRYTPESIDNTLTGSGAGDYEVTGTAFNGSTATESTTLGNLAAPSFAGVTDHTGNTVTIDVSSGTSEVTLRYSKLGETNYTTIAVTPGTPVTISGLTEGTTYYGELQGHCTLNDEYSDWSAPFNFGTLCPGPYSMYVTNIRPTRVTLFAWDSYYFPVSKQIRYKKVGGTWTYRSGPGTTVTGVLPGLTPSTHYKWQVRAFCNDSVSVWVPGPDFTTAAALVAGTGNQADDAVVATGSIVKVQPNPNKGSFTVNLALGDESKATMLTLYDQAGKQLWQQNIGSVKGSLSKAIQLPSTIASGTYMLLVQRQSEQYMEKVVIVK